MRNGMGRGNAIMCGEGEIEDEDEEGMVMPDQHPSYNAFLGTS